MSLDIEQYIRPSNLWRLAACEGSALLSAAVVAQDGEPETQEEAQIGTDVHDVVAWGMIAWRDAQGTDAIEADWGCMIDLAVERAAKVGLDSWSRRCVRLTLIFYKQLISKYEVRPENILVEHAIDMEATGIRRKGTVDLALVIPGRRVVIVDLKAGFVDQGDAEEHDQLACYSTAAACSFMADEIVVVLWQPRNERDRRVTIASFDAPALRAAAAWARSVVALARAPNPPLTAGYLQCSTCPALRRCQAAKDFIMDAITAMRLISQPDTPEEWAETVAAAKLAAKWAEPVIHAAKDRLHAGQPIPGWKLGKGRNMRFVVHIREALDVLRRECPQDWPDMVSIRLGEVPDEAAAMLQPFIGSKLADQPIIPHKGKK